MVRRAEITDLPAIYELNKEVSFEHFKPLCEADPTSFLAQDPDALLLEGLEGDNQNFKKAMEEGSDIHIYLAHTPTEVIGFVLYTQRDATLYIDLLMVRKELRAQGVAKKLMSTIFNAHLDAVICSFAILNHNEGIRAIAGTHCKKVDPIPEYYGAFLRNHPDMYSCYEFTIPRI